MSNPYPEGSDNWYRWNWEKATGKQWERNPEDNV